MCQTTEVSFKCVFLRIRSDDERFIDMYPMSDRVISVSVLLRYLNILTSENVGRRRFTTLKQKQYNMMILRRAVIACRETIREDHSEQGQSYAFNSALHT